MLELLVKNQEQITKLNMMYKHGQYATLLAVNVKHITFGQDPMEMLAQAEKECNNDIEKYLQDVNKNIHEITLESCKNANLAMLANIANLQQDFINYGKEKMDGDNK